MWSKDKVFAVREWRKVSWRECTKKCIKRYFRTQKGKECNKRKTTKYRQTEKGKEIIRKFNTKRRQLGFVPLNELFVGAVGHHIDFECVIYVPEVLHTFIPHNVWTGRGMAKINDKVFEWLENKGE